jgi:small subunit ribosomal protein S8
MALNSQSKEKPRKPMSSSFNDPIAELLTKIRNAKSAQHCHVDISMSKIKLSILEILKDKGFIQSFMKHSDINAPQKGYIRVFLRYNKARQSVINGLKRESKSGLRKYIGSQDIPRPFNGMGIAILTTHMGILEGEVARNHKVGGEIICTVW